MINEVSEAPRTPPNRGAQLLAERSTIEDTAAELGVTPRAVSRWRAGEQPSEDNKSRLQRELGIPYAAWRQPAEPPEAEEGYRDPWWLAEVTPALELPHPLALLALERHAATGYPEALADVDRQLTKLRTRYPELVSALERAELALGCAVAADASNGCAYSKAFLAASEAAA